MKQRKAEEIVAGLIGPHSLNEAVPRTHKHLKNLKNVKSLKGLEKQFAGLLAFAVELESDLSARIEDLRVANLFLNNYRYAEAAGRRPRKKKKKG